MSARDAIERELEAARASHVVAVEWCTDAGHKLHEAQQVAERANDDREQSARKVSLLTKVLEMLEGEGR
jgi:hypothetical protein